MADLAIEVEKAAKNLGFVGIAFSPVEPMVRGRDALRAWLDAGMHGEMAYMAKAPDRSDPLALLDSARTLIVVALPHATEPPSADSPPLHGRVARYAWGRDYHRVLKDQLRKLADTCAELVGGPVASRPCVDSAPLLEREAAHAGGLGFIAKNTMTILPGVGSYVFLGELLVDVAIEPGAAATPKCGECTACLDACPTGAFVGPHVLDARRCISYLTIELRGPIPHELRPLIGTWVYGCDVCQEVCPFNGGRGLPHHEAFEPRPGVPFPDLVAWLKMTSGDYRRLTKDSAISRAPRRQLARNAAVALGNLGDPAAIPHLIDALQNHKDAIVRSHAAWALNQLGGDEAREALARASASDEDAVVRSEAKIESK